ncbi:MAG: hypothetical protein R2844_20270 [Caldilineales bacterium]
MSRRATNALRWALPLALTGVLVVLLAHTSREGEILARYSRQYTRLLLATAFLTAALWWAAARQARWDRFLSRVARPGSVVLLVGAAALLALIDIFVDLQLLLSLGPLVAGVIVLWLASPRGARETEAILASTRLRNLALAATSLLVGLALAEAVFRGILVERLVPATDRQFFRAVERAWPHTVPLERSGDELRILGLADSFGQAGGEANYHFVLEDLLNQTGKPAEVVNFSVAGYEPVDELALLRGYGPRYRADLVLQGFFVGNDFNLPDRPLMMSQGVQFRPAYAGLWSLRPRNFWLQQWLPRFVQVMEDRWQRQRERVAAPPVAGVVADRPEAAAPPLAQQQGTVSEDAYLRVERERLNLMRADSATQTRWLQTLATLDETRDLAARMGSDYVLVIHPDQLQVEDALFDQLIGAYRLNPDDYDRALPQRFLLDYCARQQIRCIDLLPAFRAHGAQGGLYLPRDTHYSPAGNSVAAEQILAELNRMPASGE